MNWGSVITVVLTVLGILLVLMGMGGDRDLPVMALGVLALIAGGVLQVWSQRRS